MLTLSVKLTLCPHLAKSIFGRRHFHVMGSEQSFLIGESCLQSRNWYLILTLQPP